MTTHVTDAARVTRPTQQSPWIGLSAKLFLGSSALRVVSLVSCYAGEGTTSVTNQLKDFLREEVGLDAQVISAESFLADKGALSTAPTQGTGNAVTLVDCPPLFSSPVALQTFSKVDGVLLVLEDGMRSKPDLSRAVAMVEDVQGQLLGAILNRYREPLPRWILQLAS